MCEHDPPNEQHPGDPADPALADTGIWPVPLIPGASQEHTEPGETSRESAHAPAASIEPRVEIDEEEEDETAEIPLAAILRHRRGAEPDAQPQPETPSPVPTVESSARISAAISQLAILVDQRFNTLQSLFDREVRAEANRERIVDRLHAELQEYKQDLLLKVQRPIFIDLIQLHDDVGKMISAQAGTEEAGTGGVREILESIRTAIEDILYRQGVEPFRNEGEAFDPRRQRAVTTAPTDRPEQNRTIAVRFRPGFQAGDKVIRPEFVSVHTLRK